MVIELCIFLRKTVQESEDITPIRTFRKARSQFEIIANSLDLRQVENISLIISFRIESIINIGSRT